MCIRDSFRGVGSRRFRLPLTPARKALPERRRPRDCARASRPRFVPRLGRPHPGPLSEWPFGAGIGAPRERRECSPVRRCDDGSDRNDRSVVAESRRDGRGGGSSSSRGWLGYPPLALGFACRAFAIFHRVRPQPPFGRAFAPRATRLRFPSSQCVRPNGRSRRGAPDRKEAGNGSERDPFAFPPARAFGRASPYRLELAVRRAQVRCTRHTLGSGS